MKIDFVLTACDNNLSYLNMFPYVSDIWKKRFNLDYYLILIGEEIPENLKNYEKFIILFKPIENINSTFVAQTIRILYPALFDNKNILISDMDIVPISHKYFIESVEEYDNTFISYTSRYLKQEMLAICYNLANSNIWKKIFNIENKDDIIKLLTEWYNKDYNGDKNCTGWYTDQKQLFKYVMEYKNNGGDIIILEDKNISFKRLDKRKRDIDFIIANKNNIKTLCLEYSDLHISKRLWIEKTAYNRIIFEIFDLLKNNI